MTEASAQPVGLETGRYVRFPIGYRWRTGTIAHTLILRLRGRQPRVRCCPTQVEKRCIRCHLLPTLPKRLERGRAQVGNTLIETRRYWRPVGELRSQSSP